LRVDQTGVLAYPTKARSLGKLAFEQRTCVCIDAVLHRLVHPVLDYVDKPLQALLQDGVVILSQGVGRDLNR
jgi:hypothetical protein